MKKLLSFFAGAALCWGSILPADVSAQGTVKAMVGEAYGASGEKTAVSLEIEALGGICACLIEVEYDPTKMVFAGAHEGNEESGGVFYCNDSYMADKIRLVWSAAEPFYEEGKLALMEFQPLPGTEDEYSEISISKAEFSDSSLNSLSYESSGGGIKITGPTMKGDANLDGTIGVSDVVKINRYLVNSTENNISYTSQFNADADNSGSIDAADSNRIMNYALMVIDEL